ncbi:Remorin [Ananas comosus]|uniref:Remorin n=1 Tax=Ananas comosus TaxID=4615 RepID=A0A199VG89_ANACO|nr:Remorin [Ananas comosus]
MDYGRIRKIQLGVISPTKLKMKLLGSQSSRKGEVGNNSSRASPSKLDDMEHSRRSLLAGDLVEEDVMKDPKDGLTLGTNTNSETSELESKMDSSGVQNNRAGVSGHFKLTDSLNTAESIMPSEEDCNGNESGQDNVSTNSFEFQRGERTVQHPVIGPFIRNAPSKWNDAEKWIVNRNLMHSNPDALKKTIPQGPKSRQAIISNCLSIAYRPYEHNKFERNVRLQFFFCPAVTSVESVLMKDAGTEMTPIGSQETSRIGTPIGAITPVLSPLCSMPSTPKCGISELSDNELQLRTRREIAALGLQLGKMNIASWASKDNPEISFQPNETADAEQNARRENEARAAEWEESQRSKCVARYKHEEFKIQEWESRQKAKFEAEMTRVEAQAEQMKARAQQKMAEKLAVTRRKAERKQAIAEARRSRRAARTATQVAWIRQTGRVPSPHFLGCCKAEVEEEVEVSN